MASTDIIGVTKAMENLQLPMVVQKKSSPIPYEIALHVIEALIDLADDPSINYTWWLSYRHDIDTKLVAIDMPGCPSGKSSLKKRFDNIRLPSQINQQSRALVHRRFHRFYMMDEASGKTDELSPVLAWVQPQVDWFVPFFGSYQLKFALAERYYKQAVVLPTPAGFEMIQHVQHIWLPCLDYLSELNRSGLRSLFRMPNLTDVTVDTIDLVPENTVMHPGQLLIDVDILPWLFAWYNHSAVFNHLWAMFNTRGVRLFAVAGGARQSDVYIELFPTEDGIRMRFLHPNCTCCDHGAPKYSIIYHGEEN